MLRNLILSLAMFVSLLSTAKADVVYSFVWGGAFDIVSNWSFQAPALLTATTDVADTELLTSFYSFGTITHVSIFDPSSVDPEITTFHANGNFSDFGFDVPFDHLGTYMSLDGSVLTISEVVAAVPEPGSLALLGLGLAGLAAIRKRKPA